MAEVLPWFPFYHLDWTTSEAVLSMAPAERDAFVCLLCLQWRYGSLPFDCLDLWPLLPGNVERNAAARVLGLHFPPDPDTNRRQNPKLAGLRVDAIALAERNASRAKRGADARWDARRMLEALPEQCLMNAQSQSQSQSETTSLPPDRNVSEIRTALRDDPDALRALDQLLAASKSRMAMAATIRRMAPRGTQESAAVQWADIATGMLNALTGATPYTGQWVTSCIRKAALARTSAPPVQRTATDPFPPGKWARLAAELRKEGAA